MKKLIIILAAFVAIAAGKPEARYESCKVSIFDGVNTYEKAMTNIISVRGNEMFVSGGHNLYFTITFQQHYAGYSIYNVNGGQVEVHHNKVFVRVGNVDNVYFY